MAEGLLGGVLGEEDEKPEIEAPEALAGSEAFAAAVAARLSTSDPEVARDTSAFLKEQTQLLKVQKEHLSDEHALRLAHLAHQSHLLLGQRLGQGIRLAFQVVIALVVIVIGIGIAVMLHDAFTSHSVVIDAFEAPAALAARGVTGTVVASDVLDELTRLQDATRTALVNEKRSLTNAWSSQVKVDVPETGISLGEISRLLRARFGHDLHIGGELVETASGGLALSVRGDGVVPKTFTGGADEYQKLVVDAAQYLYAGFQPYLWGAYLGESGRCPDAIAFVRSVYASADDRERALLLNLWGGCEMAIDPSTASSRDALEKYQEAVKLRPDFWLGYHNQAERLMALGEEESAWRVGEALIQAAGGRPSNVAEYLEPFDELTWNLPAELRTEIAAAETGNPNGLNTAITDVQLHDPAAAALALQTVPADPTIPSTFSSLVASASAHIARGLWAEEIGDVSQAETEMEAVRVALANPVVTLFLRDRMCQIAPVEEAAGHPDRADAILADPAAAHFVDCQRFRGDILDHRGNWVGAQQAYAAAVALAPDLPAGYYSWGIALARHGDLAGALSKLQAANQRGPHWADPLEAWGDVLAKQGRFKQALEKYDEALKYAPNWAALKQARDTAARKRSAGGLDGRFQAANDSDFRVVSNRPR